MWHHFQTQKPLTSNIVGIIKDKTFLQHICEDLINDFIAVVVTNHWKNPFNNFDKLEFCNGLLYHDGLLYVTEGPAWLQVLQARHDTLVISHFGFDKTMELVSYDYWWSQLWKFVKEFMSSCDVYAHVKNPCHCLHGLL